MSQTCHNAEIRKFDIKFIKWYNRHVDKEGGNKEIRKDYFIRIMRKNEKASISLIKILAISLILVVITSVSVVATNVNLRSVTIIYSNNYQKEFVTGSTKVEDILREQGIELNADEVVSPELDEEIRANNTIKIQKASEVIPEANPSEEKKIINTDEINDKYGTLVEKIVVEQVEIPFETVTKEATDDNGGTKQNIVLQNGQNGLKEVTYRIKYKEGQEVERTQISETIIKEPVEKIIQVRSFSVTSRGSVIRTSAHTWSYSQDDLYLLYAITRQECGSSYEGALAVITSACNRAESSKWAYYGSDPLSQYTAPYQYCYDPRVGGNWQRYLDGNVPDYVKQAVDDALNGTRNHIYMSFRSASTGMDGEIIGGNVYFSPLS